MKTGVMFRAVSPSLGQLSSDSYVMLSMSTRLSYNLTVSVCLGLDDLFSISRPS